MKWEHREDGYRKKTGKLFAGVKFTDEDPRGPWEWSVYYDNKLCERGTESTPVTAKRACRAALTRLRRDACRILS